MKLFLDFIQELPDLLLVCPLQSPERILVEILLCPGLGRLHNIIQRDGVILSLGGQRTADQGKETQDLHRTQFTGTSAARQQSLFKMRQGGIPDDLTGLAKCLKSVLHVTT